MFLFVSFLEVLCELPCFVFAQDIDTLIDEINWIDECRRAEGKSLCCVSLVLPNRATKLKSEAFHFQN